MKYKNLNIAFLLEIFIAFGTILSISIIGPKGLAALALMAIRPLVLKREKIKDVKSHFEFSYRILFSSLSIIFIMIVSIFIIIQFIPKWEVKLPPIDILFILILPFFLLTHGVMGILKYSVEK